MNQFLHSKNRIYFWRIPPPLNIYHTADHFKGFWSWWDCYIKPLIIKIIVEIWNMLSSENTNAK